MVRAVRVVRFRVFSSSWLPAEQMHAYRLCSESFYRVTNCADFALAYAYVTIGDVSRSGSRTTTQRPWECEPRSVDHPVWSWQSTSTDQCAELVGRYSTYCRTTTGPYDLGSDCAHDHPAPDGCEVDYDHHIFVQFWGSPPGLCSPWVSRTTSNSCLENMWCTYRPALLRSSFPPVASEYMRRHGGSPLQHQPLWGLGRSVGGTTPPGSFIGGHGHPQGLGRHGGGHRIGRGHGAHAPGARPPASVHMSCGCNS